MIRLFSVLLVTIFSFSSMNLAWGYTAMPDEDNLDPALRMPVRRLHPERPTSEQLKAKRQQEKRQWEEEKARDREEYYRRLAAEQNGTEYVAPEVRKARAAKEKAHLDSLLAINYTVPKYEYSQRMRWKDDSIAENMEELLPFFNRTRKPEGVQYLPTDVNMVDDQNALYFYFNVKNSRPGALRLRAQYYADDPLGITKVEFTIDGYNYYFTPSATQEGNDGRRMFWENFDDQLSSSDKDLIYALAHSTWVRVTYLGSRGVNHVKMLSKGQIKDFYRTLTLYRSMGGVL